MNILLVEDDSDTADFILRGLREQGHAVDLSDNARDGILLATTGSYDVAVFDRLLPGMDGIDAVRVLRASSVEVPVLMLTALDGIADRVDGLEAGADDYMVKPFAFAELLARLKALHRRKPLVQDELLLTVADLELNRATRAVARAGQSVDLNPREFQILDILMTHRDELVTRTMLLEQVWGYTFDPKTSLVQTHVSRLRAKIDKPFRVELIRTVRGSGYMLVSDS